LQKVVGNDYLGALEDDDDNDDETSRICDWVLSFRNKPKLHSLTFKLIAMTSAS